MPADRPVLAIDDDLDVFLFAVVFFGGGDQRRFDALEDDLLGDVLVAVDRVNDPEQFAGIHRWSLPPAQDNIASLRSAQTLCRNAPKSYEAIT